MSSAVGEARFVGVARLVALAASLALPVCSVSQDRKNAANIGKDEDEIKHLISMYAKAADEADPSLASHVWCDSPEDSLINPVGRWHGVEEIMGFYRHDMGENYFSRNLKVKDISVRVYTDAAWAEFSWDFSATRRKEGSSVSFRGMETQIYQKSQDRWCLVHVHYSALPAQEEGGVATSAARDESEEIDRFNHKFAALHLKMDHAGILAMWADDGVDLMPGENPLTGKKAITAWLEDIQSKMTGHTVSKEELQFHDIHVSGNWASELGYRGSGNTDAGREAAR